MGVVLTATGIIERRKLEEPTIGVPGPAGNRTVDDSAPAEGEDKRRKDATTFKGTSNNDLDCTSSKEKLVETEDDFRQDGTARGWCSGNVSQTEVGQVADERARSAGEGERVTPEHPLERDNSTDHHALEE